MPYYNVFLLRHTTIDYIRSLAGAYFDPALVEIFLEFTSRL